MDPLSIAASVAGIIAAAASIAKAISPYAASLKTLPPIALRVRSEIVNAQFLLGALQNLTHNLETSLPSRTNLINIDHLEWVFTDGVFVFSELESTVLSIEPPGERLGSVSRMSWVHSEATLKGLLERLSLFKEPVLLLLNILQCNSDSQAFLNQQALHKKVDTLRTGDEQLARRMMNIEDSFDSLSLLKKQSTAVSPKDSVALEGAKSSYAAESSTWPEVRQKTDTTGDEDCGALDSTSKEEAVSSPPSITQLEEISVFTFDTVLRESRAYQRSRVDRSFLPSHTSAAQTNSWSIFSGITLSDISVIAAIALPIYPNDISNPQHYDFTRPDAPALQVRNAKSTSSMRSRYSFFDAFVDVDELWEANNEDAIGAWAQTRTKVFKLRELRYEFTCQVPEIFVTWMSSPGINPRPASPIVFLAGDNDSRRRSFTADHTDRHLHENSLRLNEGRMERLSDQSQALWLALRETVRASWLVLLETVQDMESESVQLIQRRQLEVQGLMATSQDQPDDARSIVVAIHPKTLNWDTMPQGVTRGYGITTWCDVVELFAMLGLHWMTLDVPRKTYHAEGNGLVATSQDVHGLGTVIQFRRNKSASFATQRAIPTAGIKDLAFGKVKTMDAAPWKVKDSSGRLRKMSGPRNLGLDFGSPESTVASLTRLGCNSRATQCFLRDNYQRSRLTHLFPVLFEVIGMLGRIHHSKEMPFRFLPNPTMFHWDKSAKFTERLLDSFHSQFKVATRSRHETSSRYVDGIHTLALGLLSKDWRQHFPAGELHDALQHCDNTIRDYITYGPGWPTHKIGPPGRIERALTNQDLIFRTVSCHLQEIMSLLNGKATMATVDESLKSGRSDTTPTTLADWIDEATSDDAPSKLMEIYFNIIRPKVTKDLRATIRVMEAEPENGSDSALPSIDEIWYTLVFRMICWLSLHDFDEADVQISQSLFYGSNLRVLIW